MRSNDFVTCKQNARHYIPRLDIVAQSQCDYARGMAMHSTPRKNSGKIFFSFCVHPIIAAWLWHSWHGPHLWYCTHRVSEGETPHIMDNTSFHESEHGERRSMVTTSQDAERDPMLLNQTISTFKVNRTWYDSCCWRTNPSTLSVTISILSKIGKQSGWRWTRA